MVSVIITFYERIEHLRCCLDSLRFQAGQLDEVIVSDDGSAPEVGERLRDLAPRYDFPIVHIWRPKEGFRAAEARNRGVRQARGEYLIFLDCDFVLPPGTLRVHRRAARPGFYVAGGCKYLDRAMSDDLLNSPLTAKRLRQADRRAPSRNLLKMHCSYRLDSWRVRHRWIGPQWQKLRGHFSIYRKDIERVNGFDENFVGWGGEDNDLGIRLARAGVYCTPRLRTAHVLHLKHPRALGTTIWNEGPNIAYLRRDDIPVYCENGLKK